MSITITILSIVLAVAFALSGIAKLLGVEALRQSATQLGFAWRTYQIIGVLELAGAAGLIAGFWFLPLAIASAAALGVLMVGAVYYHIRAKDAIGKMVTPLVLAVLSFVAAVLVGTTV